MIYPSGSTRPQDTSSFNKALRVTAGVALCGLLVSLLAGCFNSPEPDLTLPPQNIDQWANPLDQYVPMNLRAESYAEILLAASCMRDAGYDWNVPWRDVNQDLGPSYNSVARRLFSPSLAAQYGYRDAPSGQAANPEWQAFAARQLSPAEDTTFTDCIMSVREDELTPPAAATVNLAMGYMTVALQRSYQDSAVAAAATDWRHCMEPFGVSDLPDTPAGMPTAAIQEQFALGSAANGSPPASADEIRLASADANCRQSSGYREALYTAEWDASVRLLSQNHRELEQAKAVIDAYDEKVTVVINENAPQS